MQLDSVGTNWYVYVPVKHSVYVCATCVTQDVCCYACVLVGECNLWLRLVGGGTQGPFAVPDTQFEVCVSGSKYTNHV
jgi:hypothetical protein